MPREHEMEGVKWDYDLRDVAANRERPRTGTPYGTAAELVGVDGESKGGLRPHPGFRRVTDLEYGFGSAQNAGGFMRGFFPFTARVSDTVFAYGFLYRVVNVTQDTAAYRLKFRIGTGTTWEYDVGHGFPLGLITPEAYDGEDMDVVLNGRYVYVFRSGLPPFLFYFHEDPPGTYTLRVETELGSGPKPALIKPENSAACARSRSDLPSQPHPDLVEALPVLTVPASDVDAECRIIYFGFSQAEICSLDGVLYVTNPYLEVRNATGGTLSLALRGPSDLRLPDNSLLWTTPPFPDPSFAEAIFFSGGVKIPPTYPFPTTEGENEGIKYRADLRDEEGEEPIGLTADNAYVWAYRLFDSRSGRRSAISDRVLSAALPSGRAAYDYTLSYDFETGKRVNKGLRQVTFPMLYGIYDTTRYDTLLLYRGRQTVGLDVDQVLLSLEYVVKLSDYHTTNGQPADTDWKVFGFFAQLTDDELVVQPTYQASTSYMEEMPTAGTAILYENVLLAGNLAAVDDIAGDPNAEVNGRGIARWSSTYESSIELFDVNDRYVLGAPAEEIESFIRVGPNVIGISRRDMYLFRRETVRLKAFPMHAGFGIVSPRAACTVGSEGYYVTTFGVKTVDSRGVLSQVASLDDVILRDWAEDITLVEMAYDATMGVAVILNPALYRAVLLWFNTSLTTELHDTTFAHVTEGDVPDDPDEELGEFNQLRARACFVGEAETTNLTGKRWRVFVMDYRRAKSTAGRFLNYSGTAVITTASATSPGINFNVGFNANNLGVENCYLYVLDGTHAGEKFRIRAAGALNNVILDTNAPGLPAGTRVVISPVYFRWIGHQLGLPNPEMGDLQTDDLFQLRQLNQIGCVFSDVSPPPSNSTVARFRGLAYSGNEDTPENTAIPVATNGDDMMSVTDGPSLIYASFMTASYTHGGVQGAVLFPGVEIVCPDLDFRLLAVRAKGRVDATDRQAIPTTTRPS